MKRLCQFFTVLVFAFLCLVLQSKPASAYVQLEYSYDGSNLQYFNPGSAAISSATTYLDLYDAILSSGTAFTSQSPWGLQPLWYAGLQGSTGNYLNVNADYWFAWTDPGSSYTASNRNIMTESNLRCAVGDSLSAYDSTYSPTISGYSVQWFGPYSSGSTSKLLYRVHIQFKYSQQLSVTHHGGNVRCGWNRSPTNGLFFQWINTSSQNRGSIAYENTGTTATLSSSKTDSLLETQVGQNNTIINQNDTIINNISDIEDSITDSSIDTSDINAQDITVPSFGPIATIVNSLINVPNAILNVGSCSPLSIPLPGFVGGSLTLPCPSSFLAPYQTAVNLVEDIAAAYIWFRVAVYIANQVKKLRDPTNDDEEYLDI